MEIGRIREVQMKKFIKYFFCALLVFVVIMLPLRLVAQKIGGIRVFSGEENLMEQMTPIAVDTDSPFYEAFQSKDRVNVLLLGVNDGMTDTIMLGSYDMKHQHVDVISVPRDTYYERPGYKGASLKINSIYHGSKNGGAVGTAEAVSTVLQGMPIHYYVVVDYDGVKNIVDAIGGVEMQIPFHMKYDDPTDKPPLHIDIPEGMQTIDSSNVVQFLRFRHANAGSGYKSYPEGDIGRVKMQQQFLKEAFKQSLGLQLPKVAKSVLKNVDSDLDIGMGTSIAAKASGLTSEDMETYTLPGASGTIGGLSFWKQDVSATQDMLMEIYAIGDGEEETDSSEQAPEEKPGFFKNIFLKIFGSGSGGESDGESDSQSGEE